MSYLKGFYNFKDLLIKKNNIFFAIIIFVIFLLDRIAKINVINNLKNNSIYVNDYLNFELIWNIGIGFGFLSTNSNLLYNLITLIIGIIIMTLIYFSILSKNIDKIIFAIIIGGACGNFYDRLVYMAVPDFIDLHYQNFHWFIFNVADIFITLGIFFFILRSFFTKN